jgi:hypothetical protein
MANLGTTFDASGVEPAAVYDLLPAGDYLVQIVESELRPTRDGNGQYLWLMLDVLDGPCQGRKLFDQLNLVNRNSQTVEIAQRTLSSICHATGRMQVADSAELHLIPITVSVTIEAPKNGYGAKNRIRYRVPEAAAAVPTRTPPAPARAAAPPKPPVQKTATATPPPTAPRAPTAPWKRQA